MMGAKGLSGSVMVVALALLACSMGDKEEARYEAIEKKACACADKTCADSAFADFKQAFNETKTTRVNQENSQRISKASEKTTICLIKQGVAISEITAAVQ
jgi:hypothetical protein